MLGAKKRWRVRELEEDVAELGGSNRLLLILGKKNATRRRLGRKTRQTSAQPAREAAGLAR